MAIQRKNDQIAEIMRYGVDTHVLKRFKADFPLGRFRLREAGIKEEDWDSLSDRVFTFETMSVLDDLASQCAGDYSFLTRHEKMPQLRGTKLHPRAFFNLNAIGRTYDEVAEALKVSVDTLIQERLTPVYYGQVLTLYEMSPLSKILVPKA